MLGTHRVSYIHFLSKIFFMIKPTQGFFIFTWRYYHFTWPSWNALPIMNGKTIMITTSWRKENNKKTRCLKRSNSILYCKKVSRSISSVIYSQKKIGYGIRTHMQFNKYYFWRNVACICRDKQFQIRGRCSGKWAFLFQKKFLHIQNKAIGNLCFINRFCSR